MVADKARSRRGKSLGESEQSRGRGRKKNKKKPKTSPSPLHSPFLIAPLLIKKHFLAFKMAASRPLVTVQGLDGTASGQTALPAVFTAPIRPDVVLQVRWKKKELIELFFLFGGWISFPASISLPPSRVLLILSSASSLLRTHAVCLLESLGARSSQFRLWRWTRERVDDGRRLDRPILSPALSSSPVAAPWRPPALPPPWRLPCVVPESVRDRLRELEWRFLERAKRVMTPRALACASSSIARGGG